MNIQTWNIQVDGNVGGHVIKGTVANPWYLRAEGMEHGNDKSNVSLCAYIDADCTIKADCNDFDGQDLTAAFTQNTPKTIAKNITEPLLDSIYGPGNWVAQ